MNPDHWQRAKDLFGQACERAPDQRASFLAEACLGDEDLRREVSSRWVLTGDRKRFISRWRRHSRRAWIPWLDAPSFYRIIRQIGRGGMGSVYLVRAVRRSISPARGSKGGELELVDETLRHSTTSARPCRA
jgi:serine/threonine-protein kinase